MSTRTRAVLAVVLAAAWVVANEFLRNQVLFVSRWEDHYASLGLAFPAGSVNGLVWMVWAFVFAGVVYTVSRRFGLGATALLGWVAGWVMMWLVIWNLDALPVGLLWFAVPWSAVEAFVAALICVKVAPAERAGSGAGRAPAG